MTDTTSGHDPAAPIKADVHHQNDIHDDQLPAQEKNQSRTKAAPRPDFLQKLINSGSFHSSIEEHHSIELDRYFHGPRDLDKHSKWPIFMRMHGSIMPKLILPLLFVAGWSTAITCISKFVYSLHVNQILLTVLGFLVGLSLSFRSSTAYERWADGRKSWALLVQVSRNMARIIWVDVAERAGEQGKEDLLRKLTALNLILGFAIALKHRLRFEPDVAYDDLAGLIGYLDTFAREAHDPDMVHPPPKSTWKAAGEYLGFSFAESNPRKRIKRAKKPLGNLPLEILNHLSVYVNTVIKENALPCAGHQAQLIQSLASLNEVLTGTERVLDTPLPAAYSIAIAQIAWVYVLVLPFQLYEMLQWITIPGSVVAAYIIIGLATIGVEIENPFGHDVNDLPLDTYCRQLALELDIIKAIPPPTINEFAMRDENFVMYPLSMRGYSHWKEISVEDIRAALRAKVVANVNSPTTVLGFKGSVMETSARLDEASV